MPSVSMNPIVPSVRVESATTRPARPAVPPSRDAVQPGPNTPVTASVAADVLFA